MTITIAELRKWSNIEKVVIHSLDMCLYQASIMREGREDYVTDAKGKFLRSFNLLEMQALFESLPVAEMVLRQQSPYDEMVGQPVRDGENALEVPLFKSDVARAAPTVQ